MKAYLTAFSDQLSGYIDIDDGDVRSIIFLPFLEKNYRAALEEGEIPYVPVRAAKFEIVKFLNLSGLGLKDRIPHYRFVGFE